MWGKILFLENNGYKVICNEKLDIGTSANQGYDIVHDVSVINEI